MLKLHSLNIFSYCSGVISLFFNYLKASLTNLFSTAELFQFVKPSPHRNEPSLFPYLIIELYESGLNPVLLVIC